MTLPDIENPRAEAPRRRLRRVAIALLAIVAAAATLTVAMQPAAADNPPMAHDPFGNVDSFAVDPTGAVRAIGWATDPDAATSNARVYGIVDGHWKLSADTSIARGYIARTRHTSPTPGFDITIPSPATGTHVVCVGVRNVGAGIHRLLGCTVTPKGTRLTSAQLAAHNPRGTLSAFRGTATSIEVTGWANEPDFLMSPVLIVVYVDGVSSSTVVSHTATAAQRSAGSATNGAFDITVPVSTGAHIGCVWAVNAGLGSNVLLGCQAADTRGRAGSGAVPTPTVNTNVVKEAKRHIGQPYVWGATGPKKFDCSGLVLYSYAKAGRTTPRIAQDQFTAARLIPAARAVPGDLVFYHDNTGSVYHVGIYLSPLNTVAAIDEQEGVDYQHIWDPSTATYGSFTHT